jgi:protocatechuate 3,4-dioxygenase beta subunit
MTPRAVISGRVVDEAGDPVQGVRVQTVPVTPGSTPAMLMPAPNPATDDRGEFRLIGPAGKYYIQATVNSGGGTQERPEKRSDGTSEAIYGTTFYPSSVRKDRGTVVEAVAGKDVSGIEIRLARQQQGLAISGVVSGTPEGPSRAYVSMQFGESAQRISSSRSTGVGADGKFRFDGLQPGFYRVSAVYNDGKPQMASRSMEWQLENTEIANVELVLSPGLDLVGTVKMEGEAVGALGPKRKVKLEPALGYSFANLTMTGGEVDPDGAFRIGNIVPGKYRVKVESLAENAYIKTLEIEGAAVTNGMADLSKVARGASAKVVLGSNGAQISGRVLDANGERMPTSVVMIFLARDADDISMVGNGTAQSTPDGKYTIKAVVPGKYRLFALNAFEISGAAGVDGGLDMFKKMLERGEEIEFKEGDRIAKDLKVIPVEDPNAKPKE